MQIVRILSAAFSSSWTQEYAFVCDRQKLNSFCFCPLVVHWRQKKHDFHRSIKNPEVYSCALGLQDNKRKPVHQAHHTLFECTYAIFFWTFKNGTREYKIVSVKARNASEHFWKKLEKEFTRYAGFVLGSIWIWTAHTRTHARTRTHTHTQIHQHKEGGRERERKTDRQIDKQTNKPVPNRGLVMGCRNKSSKLADVMIDCTCRRCQTRHSFIRSAKFKRRTKQVHLVSAEAECPNHPSRGGVASQGGVS